MPGSENKSYFAAGSNTWSAWSSRSATPKPAQAQEANQSASDGGLQSQRGGDHAVSSRHRVSLKIYPEDCPKLPVRWFHATDVPKRRPFAAEDTQDPEKPAVPPKKWAPFSASDSRAIEITFQKLADEAESGSDGRRSRQNDVTDVSDLRSPLESSSTSSTSSKVAVNEDFLFDVDIDERELSPAYWLGPVYEVRRGTWFYQEGSNLRPCDENLANQLEEGFVKIKPWRFAQPDPKQSAQQTRSRPTSLKTPVAVPKTIADDVHSHPTSSKTPVAVPKSIADEIHSAPVSVARKSPSQGNLALASAKDALKDQESPPSELQNQIKTYRLFGTHMNSVVTYQNVTNAWLLTDDLLSRMSSTVYERFAGGGYLAGVKLVRGFVDTKVKAKAEVKKADEPNNEMETAIGDVDDKVLGESEHSDEEPAHSPAEKRRMSLERQMSSFVASQTEDRAQQEEEVRKRDEKEITDDYKDDDNMQGREIEHLLLVTHGIGQRLGLRMESVNFVHDANTLRKTMKAVYANSPDLQTLNEEVDKPMKNCRVQVLPICWRHLLDFPKQSLKHNRKEHDLGDANFDEQEYPNLDDITIEGVPAVRNLITDLALDILLYQSPAYKDHISRIVLQECNRTYTLFKERNPLFNGKISFVGHSLGSAIMFDILCRQKNAREVQRASRRLAGDNMALDFEVDDFYALGSPIGLFQMLKGRTIASRGALEGNPSGTPGSTVDDPFLGDVAKSTAMGTTSSRNLEIATSAPKCGRLFNIFHPTDPISYRIEPLISPAMSELKPQALPYTKKGIFGAPVGQGLTGIGARVGQSVSGFWSSFSSGIASSLLNRSLGITEDPTKARIPVAGQQVKGAGEGSNVVSGVFASLPGNKDGDKQARVITQDDIRPGDVGEHPPTLIDSGIETLYAGFQKQRQSQEGERSTDDVAQTSEWLELEERSRKLRREEAKVRALNSNGRVDYAIQEGAFDISILASSASHLSYWADEDVSHFMISQLLARHRIIKKS